MTVNVTFTTGIRGGAERSSMVPSWHDTYLFDKGHSDEDFFKFVANMYCDRRDDDLSADVTKSSFNGHVGWRMNSVSLYAKLLF